VLSFVTQQTLEMTAADLVVLALPDADRQHLTISHAAGQNAQAAVGLRLPARASISGQVLADGQPITVEDFRHDPRVSRTARETLELGPAMLLPLGDGDNVRGVLTVGRAAGALPLPRAAGQLAMTFAAQAGIALELAERRQDAERLSIYEDRDRIARDLHDQVIQQLYASGMKLQGTIPMITRPLVEERVNSVVDDLDQTITDIRAVIFSLQARGKDLSSLRSNVMAVVGQMTEAHGMSSSVQLPERLDQEVPAEIGEHLLYALREALSNAARHGRATHVDVTILVDGKLSLLVHDNGTGIKDSTRRSGLANLAGRAEPYGGSLTVGPGSGGGTELFWQVPLPSAASATA
jgi:signal transduction histidine kinase